MGQSTRLFCDRGAQDHCLEAAEQKQEQEQDWALSSGGGWSWEEINGDLPEETTYHCALQDSREQKKDSGPEAVMGAWIHAWRRRIHQMFKQAEAITTEQGKESFIKINGLILSIVQIKCYI